MKHLIRLALALTVAMALWDVSIAAPKPVPQILATNLDALRVNGKVNGVIWTRRADRFTLQILVPVPERPADWPTIDAWLLRANGSRIEPVGRWESAKCGRPAMRCLGNEVQYSFPLSVAQEAVAAVLRVDDDTRTGPLTRFPQ